MVVSQQRCTFMHTCIATTTLPSTVVYTSAGYEHQRNPHVHKEYKYLPLCTMNPPFTLASLPACISGCRLSRPHSGNTPACLLSKDPFIPST